MGMFALIDIILLAITRLTVELETMVQQTGIIGLMLVLSLLVKFLVLYLQLKLAIGVTTPISIERTTTQSSSVFDVYKKYLGVNTLGQTEFWTYSTHKELSTSLLAALYK